MRCLSLWQPWASALACGSKQMETRSWSTRYRGTILIHAAKRRRIGELISYGCSPSWRGALDPVVSRGADGGVLLDGLPFGAIVGIAELTACIPTGSLTVVDLDTKRQPKGHRVVGYVWTERMMGDFTPGRFAWLFEDVRMIDPIPCRGRQGLFVPTPDVVAALEEGAA